LLGSALPVLEDLAQGVIQTANGFALRGLGVPAWVRINLLPEFVPTGREAVAGFEEIKAVTRVIFDKPKFQLRTVHKRSARKAVKNQWAGLAETLLQNLEEAVDLGVETETAWASDTKLSIEGQSRFSERVAADQAAGTGPYNIEGDPKSTRDFTLRRKDNGEVIGRLQRHIDDVFAVGDYYGVGSLVVRLKASATPQELGQLRAQITRWAGTGVE
jgi:hypothetical protein